MRWLFSALRMMLVLTALLGLAVPAAAKGTISKKKKPAATTKRQKSKSTRPRRTSRSTPPKPAAPLKLSEIKDAEQRLEDLGYWTGPIDGKLDETSRSALIAFQKVTGRSRNGKLTRAERSAVLRSTRPEPLEKGAANVEIDLRRQVLFVVDDSGIVSRTLPVSTGSGQDFFAEGFERTAVTPPGRFTIQGKIAGWKKSALGRLYYPNYIIGGIAIHGYSSVPAKPASHGCIRIPMFAAKEFSRIIPVGMTVIVHEGRDPSEPAAEAPGRNR